MKRGIIVLIIIFSTSNQPAQAQFFKKLKDKINQKIEDQVDNTIDKTTEDVLNKKKGDSDVVVNEERKTEKESSNIQNNNNSDTTLELWNKYDFIPGEKIFFYDDFKYEEYGEFPSKWNLAFGNAEIARLGNEKVTHFKSTDNGTALFPLINTKDYIDGYTTIEFDIYFDEEFFNNIHQDWIVGFYDISQETSIYGSYYKDGNGDDKNNHNDGGKIEIDYSNGAIDVSMGGKYNGKINKKDLNDPVGWHHIAITINNNNLKFYIDEHKLLNIPKINFNPFRLFIFAYGRENATMTLRNVQLAKGGDSAYKQIITEGKYSTNGILFDSGQAKIKPQSHGIIKKIMDILQDNPDWMFTIIGHTDNDGDETSNLKLSQKRAEAVKNILIEKGISADRLKTKGKGETQPLNQNTNDLEKANNRRVEFIKI